MITAIGALLVAAATFAQQTDTTFAVPAGARLEVNNMSGPVQVTAWDRDAVRVRARHASTTTVDIDRTGNVVRLRVRSDRGMPSADLDVSVPRSMSIDVDGTFTNATVTGTTSQVAVRTVHGNVTVRGGSDVRAEAVQGAVTVENASGTVEAKSVNQHVRVSGARGDVRAEAINGNIAFERIQSSNVRGATVNGRVSYDGTIRDGGRYNLVSHSGDVVLVFPAGANATLSLATMSGEFNSELPLQVTESRPGRRITTVVGTGSARVELETFSGRVRITRAQ